MGQPKAVEIAFGLGNKDEHIAALDTYVDKSFSAWTKDYIHYTTTFGLKAPTKTHGSTHGSTHVSTYRVTSKQVRLRK